MFFISHQQSSVTDPAEVFADILFPMCVERQLLHILFRLYKGRSIALKNILQILCVHFLRLYFIVGRTETNYILLLK